jgi:N6-adenosine-specific RNA methylase IME4
VNRTALASLRPGSGAPASAWAARITACWAASREAVFEVGRLLIAAKEALAHGEFGKMIEADLPFEARTAQMLMKISADDRLSDARLASFLPPSYSTLFEITKLTTEQIDAGIAVGTIRPDMRREDIRGDIKAERRREREQQLGEKQMALPQQKFGVIVADPEWRFEPWSRPTGLDRAADNHYPTSCTEVIAARDVPSIAADDCVLFLWATAPMLPQALVVMAAWGFDYKSHIVWAKIRGENGERAVGTGYWFRNCHELLLVGTRGNIPAPAMGSQWLSVIEAIVRGHSTKPESILKMIEEYFPTLPKIELNRRGPARKNWSAWGNEAEQPITESAAATATPAPSPSPAAAPEPAPSCAISGAGSPF